MGSPLRELSGELLQKLITDARPTYVNGRWRKPHLSAMQLAKLRKQYHFEGIQFPEIPKNKKIRDFVKPPQVQKGHKFQREKEARNKKIKENMAKMPKMIAEYRAVRFK